jgi:hypothetical protein
MSRFAMCHYDFGELIVVILNSYLTAGSRSQRDRIRYFNPTPESYYKLWAKLKALGKISIYCEKWAGQLKID